MKKLFILILAVPAMVITSGCMTPVRIETDPPRIEGTQYGSPNQVVGGTADHATFYDLNSAAKALVSKFVAHPVFAANYKTLKAKKKDALPIIEVARFDNLTTDARVRSLLPSVEDTVRSALFDTGLFEVKNEAASGTVKDRILRGADGGLENGALVQTIGTHESPDYLLMGDVRQFRDEGGIHTYRFHLSAQDLATGKVVWEGIETRVKF
ncbi:MAG: hypothetical protein ACI4RA_07890 [Kiritimatiellia bacterium]